MAYYHTFYELRSRYIVLLDNHYGSVFSYISFFCDSLGKLPTQSQHICKAAVYTSKCHPRLQSSGARSFSAVPASLRLPLNGAELLEIISSFC